MRLVKLPMPPNPSVSIMKALRDPTLIGSRVIQIPLVCDTIPSPTSKSDERRCCPRLMKAWSRIELFPVLVGPAAAMMAKGSAF